MSTIIKILFGTAIRKWVTIGLISAVVSIFSFTAYKENLREEGADEAIQECNEAIYEANQAALEQQLGLEKKRSRELELRNEALRAENEAAIQRRQVAESRVTQLLSDREQQAENDEEYRNWSGDAAPDGVFNRLRELQRDSSASPNSD